ncbi:MAG: hypothetical protein H0Z32_15000 [Bacillaceae bacterium]|nr:hypothetical protein [Bacillaceae bacterium]
MKWKMWMGTILILLLTACQAKEMTFTAENENWYAEYKVNQTEDTQETSFVISYAGEDTEKVSKADIEYHFIYPSGETAGTDRLTEDGMLKGTGGGCSGCAFIEKDDQIQLTFTVNGETEKMILRTE